MQDQKTKRDDHVVSSLEVRLLGSFVLFLACSTWAGVVLEIHLDILEELAGPCLIQRDVQTGTLCRSVIVGPGLSPVKIASGSCGLALYLNFGRLAGCLYQLHLARPNAKD